MLLEINADAAEEDVAAADISFVGARGRINGRQEDVVSPRQEPRRERVVTQATAAIHRSGAAGECQNPHRSTTRTLRRLEGTRAEQEIDDVAFVGLEPVELNRRNRTEVEAIDMDRVDQAPAEVRVIGD